MTIPLPEPACERATYDGRVQDGSGWVYLLPPLRGLRVFCIDPIGTVAHRLAAEGAEVTVLLPSNRGRLDRPDWAPEWIEPSRRQSSRRLHFCKVGSLREASPSPHDGIVLHDIDAGCITAAELPALLETFAELREHLAGNAFVYVGARNRHSPWSWRASGGAGAPRAGLSSRERRALQRAAGVTATSEHPYLLSGAKLLEVLGRSSYRAVKNRERPIERLKEMLLGPILAGRMAPGHATLGHRGPRPTSLVERICLEVGKRLAAREAGERLAAQEADERLAAREGERWAAPNAGKRSAAPDGAERLAARHPGQPQATGDQHRTGGANGQPRTTGEARRRLAKSDTGKEPDIPPAVSHYFVLHAGKVVLNLEWPDRPPATVVLAREPLAIERRNNEAILLSSLPGLPARLAALLPQTVDRFELAGVEAFVMSCKPGVTCDRPVPGLSRITRAAYQFLVELHQHTQDVAPPGRIGAIVADWCRTAAKHVPAMAPPLARLGDRLQVAVCATDLPLVCMHGDFKIENVMYDPKSLELTGVIDWELGERHGLPLLDLLYLLYFNRVIHGQDEFAALAAVCHPEGLAASEQAMLAGYYRALKIDPAAQPLLMAAFVLHHFARRIQAFTPDPESAKLLATIVDGLASRIAAGGTAESGAAGQTSAAAIGTVAGPIVERGSSGDCPSTAPAH